MYNPLRFQGTDKTEAFDLMYHYPFATLISQTDTGPFVSHLPLTPIKHGDDLLLVGHMASANPHGQLIGQNKVTVVFNGPHTYITPVWYTKNDVPTWNYLVAHAVGTVTLLKDSESLIECLKTLSDHVEHLWPSGWEFYIPKDLQGSVLEKSIVGFQIKIEKLDFKKKLSQNKSPQDHAGILNGLEKRTDQMSKLVLAEMQKTK